MNKLQTINNAQTTPEFPKILGDILGELRLIRNEMMLLFPQDDLEDYAHPDRIKNSYNQVIKEHPPVSFRYGNH